jgi:O-antigen ligase
LVWTGFACLLCIILAFPYFVSLFEKNESVLLRNELALAAFTLWKSRPLFGAGLNTFLIHLPTLLPSRYLFFLQPPHSIYLLLLSELGIIGGVYITTSLYLLVKKLVRLPNKLPLILLGMYGMLGLIDHYPITLQQGQLLTTVIVTLSFLSR